MSAQPEPTPGERLRRVLLAGAALRGIYSVEGLATATGVARDTMQRWWGPSPTKPSSDSLAILAGALGMRSSHLVDLWTSPETPMPVLSWGDDRSELAGRLAELEATVALLVERDQSARGTGARARRAAPPGSAGSAS